MTPRPDPDRYEALVRSCAPRVYRAALSVLSRPEDAEDVVGEVFLRLLDGRLDLEGAHDPCAFLAAVAARAALQHRRGAGRRRSREDRHAMEDRQSAPAPDQHLTEHESREELRRELARLPDDLRLSVSLRFEGGLTYADIGAALGCAEPTAHDRVRRGLQTLRSALGRAGLIAVAASLEEHLLAAAAPAPPGLEGRLLALSSRATAATAGLAPWVPLALGVAAAGTLAFAAPRWLDPDPARSTHHAPALAPAAHVSEVAAHVAEAPAVAAPAGQDERRPANRPPVERDDPPLAAPPTGWVTGRVLDPGRFPVVDATVVVVSTQRSGKRPAYAHEGRTDANGSFRLPVTVEGSGGRNVIVTVRRLGYVALQSPVARVEVGQAAALGELTLELPEGDGVGDYSLSVTLVTPSGEVDAGARIQVEHLVKRPHVVTGDWSTWLASGNVLRQPDANGVTDATGSVVLAGARIGSKVVRVRPRDPRWAVVDVPVTVGLGANELIVPLVATRTIAGRVRTPAGGVPDRLNADLLWSVDTNVWTHVEIDAEGRFEVGGLSPEPYELWVRPVGNAPWTTARRRVAADERFVDLVLKRADDPRDVGDHAAELHGRLVDDAGQPVAWEDIQLEEWWFDARAEGDWERDLLPNHLSTPPVQRAAMWEDGEDPYPARQPSADFHLTGLKPGRRIVYLSVPGYALDVAGPFDLAEGEILADLELRLRAAAGAEVVVLDTEGRRVEGAGVFVCGTGPYSEGLIAASDAGFREVDGRGYFHANRFRRTKRGAATIERLPAGRSLRLVAIHPDHEPVTSAELLLQGGEERRVELRFARRR